MMLGTNKKRLWALGPKGVVQIKSVQPGDLSFRMKTRGFASTPFSGVALLQM